MKSALAVSVSATGLATVRRFKQWQLLVVAWLVFICLPLTTWAATLPAGFTETIITGLSVPTAMTFAPDGRLFVCQQTGALRVIKNGALLAAPFLTLSVDFNGERGLLGVAFDPNFPTNNFIYVYYTVPTAPIHNRVSRFTANGDVVVPGSEVVILELNNLSSATNHNGGAIHFGADNKLYVAVGENANSANAQTFSNLLGKMLRINTDPANLIPTDNPYFNDPNVSGINKAIWALGLRNPFTFGFQQGTGRLFINDVGEVTWEEINEGVAHSNYGWRTCEGNNCTATPPTDYRGPLYVYPHSGGTPSGCAIVGGAFYNPQTQQFPAQYVGMYFFADLCTGFIRYVDPGSGAVIPSSTAFATGVPTPVDLQVSSDGSLWYLFRGTASPGVGRIQFPAGQIPPMITQHPQSQTIPAGQPVTFDCNASGATPLNFQWQRNNVDIPGATGTSYMISSVMAADNNAQFRCVASNAFGTAPSNNATLTVLGSPFSPGNVLISEFRFDGPNGTSDEFLELYNNTDSAITVSTIDGSSGWSVAYAVRCQPCPPNGEQVGTYFVIPNGTVIPARGHFLFTNTHDNGTYVGYSLGDYGGANQALGDAVSTAPGLALDLVDDFWEGYALFNTSNPTHWSLLNRLDAVEGVSNLNSLFDSGTGISAIADYYNVAAQYSWARRLQSGLPQDTDNSAADWVLVSNGGPFTRGDGSNQSVPAILGAPGPENLTSPVQRNAQVKASLIEPQQPAAASPNRVRDSTPNVCGGGSPCALGTLEIRRRFRNTTGVPISRLRFRIVDVTTLNTPNPGGAQADLRLITSGDTPVTTSLGSLTVRGTLIEVPPNLAVNGGGLHASALTTLPGLLQPGATVDIRFLLGAQAVGTFRFLVNVEALPGPAGAPEGGKSVNPKRR
ncbi:MAG TPA: PQQ-dependent sugar dehydrogenase [Pyrinomonadaceae bacterium]|nr:PQQ-dependent sugar dehydrogenase [Pyrinomonadaceae bacterium]